MQRDVTVHDVRGTRQGAQLADRARSEEVHLDEGEVVESEEASQGGLPIATPSTHLRHHSDRYVDGVPGGEGQLEQPQHSSVPPLDGDERAGILEPR